MLSFYHSFIIFRAAWLVAGEEKTCKDTEGVTLAFKDKFTNILDCASVCKAKLQNTMFAFETSAGCSKEGCDCYCIETAEKECATEDKKGFTLYQFRGDEPGILFFIDM